ncbi:MAG: hypothetical protein ABEJ64_02635 [Candidatus Nanohaloarchaea archaeon]
MESIDTGPTPSYEEVMDRFGEKVSLSEALDKTSTLQDRYPELTGIGSIIASEQVYGQRDLRHTSRGLDFIAPAETIVDMASEYDESWQYDQAVVFPVEEVDGEEWSDEWMCAVIPTNCAAFQDEKYDHFMVTDRDIDDSPVIDTEHGPIKAVPPELGFASKLRRYMMQKENRGSFKTGDLVDLTSITLRDAERDEQVFHEESLDRYTDRYLTETPDGNELMDDTLESLESEDSMQELSTEEVEAVLRDLKELDLWQ